MGFLSSKYALYEYTIDCFVDSARHKVQAVSYRVEIENGVFRLYCSDGMTWNELVRTAVDEKTKFTARFVNPGLVTVL